MSSIANVRGLLLEEVALFLLSRTAYRTVTECGTDPTLRPCSAGIQVCGRGGRHQIDAIADSLVNHPFSYPQRLLVEAKCFAADKKVELETIRNAVGVLKDVNEYWVPPEGTRSVPKQRYHYQYAMFSATPYSTQAQTYAFAQDVYLIPLTQSRFFVPVVEAIRGVEEIEHDWLPNMKPRENELRQVFRQALTRTVQGDELRHVGIRWRGIERVLDVTHRIGFALLGMLGSRFPIFLVPSPMVDGDDNLQSTYSIRVFRDRDDKTWLLRDRRTNRDLFSFDLPRELFLEYAENNMLTASRALDLKQEVMPTSQAFHVRNGVLQLIQFQLDQDWLANIRADIDGRA